MMKRLPSSIEIDDLIQVGMIGLIEALERYEEQPGATLETYVKRRIRGAMLDELREMDFLPRRERTDLRRIEAAVNVLQQRLGRNPTETETASELGVSIEQYHRILRDAIHDQLVCLDEHDTDFLDDKAAEHAPDLLTGILDEESRRLVTEEIESLPERDRAVMELYYDDDLMMKKVGLLIGMSESGVFVVHERIIKRLREKLSD